MNWYGSGYIIQLIYAVFGSGAADNFSLLTEDGQQLLTEDGNVIEIEH